jgi:hypothetical protein
MADPVTIGAIAQGAGVATQIIGGLIAYYIAKGDREKARSLLEQAAQMAEVDLPELERLVAEEVGPSAFEDIKTDPALRDAQMAALDRLQQIDQEGGLLLADKANLNKVLGQTNRAAASQNAAVREDMAARGVGGSGAEMAMQLANNQAQAQRGGEQGLDIAAMAQQRALDAIMARGQLAGDVRGQDFGEQSQIAQAKDLISRYNADSRSKAKYHNAGLGQQHFDNQMRRNQGRAAAKKDMANWYTNEANAKAAVVGGASNAIGYGAQQAGNYYYDDAQKKRTE